MSFYPHQKDYSYSYNKNTKKKQYPTNGVTLLLEDIYCNDGRRSQSYKKKSEPNFDNYYEDVNGKRQVYSDLAADYTESVDDLGQYDTIEKNRTEQALNYEKLKLSKQNISAIDTFRKTTGQSSSQRKENYPKHQRHYSATLENPLTNHQLKQSLPHLNVMDTRKNSRIDSQRSKFKFQFKF